MSFSDPSTTRTRPENSGSPIRTKSGGQGSPTFKHIPAEEQNPSRLGNTHFNPIPSAADSGDRTDDAQCRRGTGNQTQFTCEDVNGTGWGPEFFPESEIPGSPTVVNSPTRYEALKSPLESQKTYRRPSHARTAIWKAPKIKIRKISSAKGRSSLNKIRKKLSKTSRFRRQDNAAARLVPKTISSFIPSRNKFMDCDGNTIFPTIREFYDMTDSDEEEWRRTIAASGD